MARVECEVSDVSYRHPDNDEWTVTAICVRCGLCDHEVEVHGDSDRSVRRGLGMLREECPRGERNFYVADEDGRS